MIVPRPYQREAARAAWVALRGQRSALVVMPTGTGKTVLFLMFAKAMVERGRRVLILAHRDELIEQPRSRMAELGLVSGLEKGASKVPRAHGDLQDMVVVSSVQTMFRDSRLARFDPNDFGLIIIDEAHHAHGKTKMYAKVLNHFGAAQILGVTATPDAAKGGTLAEIFDSVAFSYDLREAIADGWLVPIRQKFVQVTGLDYSSLKRSKGELEQGKLSALLEQADLLQRMVFPTIEVVEDAQAICFTASVAQAYAAAELLRRQGRSAVAVAGGQKAEEKKQRREGIAAFRRGDVQFLVNCQIATEGFDHPPTAFAVMWRPFLSRALYAQCVGRGTRPLGGTLVGLDDAEPVTRRAAIERSDKPWCTVLDFAGNAGRHDLVTTFDLLDGADEGDAKVRRRAKEMIQEGASDADALKLARAELEEAARRADVSKSVTYSVLDAGSFGGGSTKKGPSALRAMALFGMPRLPGPVAVDRRDSPVYREVRYLQSMSIDAVADGLTEPEVQALFQRVYDRNERQMSTPRQIRILMRAKVSAEDAMALTSKEATSLVTELKNNDWRRPLSWDRKFSQQVNIEAFDEHVVSGP